jgi:beta-phosphoglucomutase-like phosphatase (HAD superfamily)
MSRLNVEPESVVVVEDGIYGIESAQSAGIQNIIKVSSPRDLDIELLINSIGQF